ncbi:MAG: hypothetical protein ACLPVF_10810 [Acidimicrobiales bacterium]
MSNRREKDTFAFTPPDLDRITGYLLHLNQAGGGWINLMPGVALDDKQTTTVSAGLFSLFGNRQAPVTMTTVMPAPPNRQASEGVTIGLLHPTGGKAVARLAEAGVPVPDGWQVRQDHARRGLLVRAPGGTPERAIVEWSLEAGAALCREDLTGEWQAVVYLP